MAAVLFSMLPPIHKKPLRTVPRTVLNTYNMKEAHGKIFTFMMEMIAFL